MPNGGLYAQRWAVYSAGIAGTASTESTVASLRALDSCAVADACDRLGLTPRVLRGVTSLTGAARIAGRVVTVLLGPPDDGHSEGPERHLCAAATDASTAIDVIVVAHQGRDDCAGWGGNLSRAARERAVAGTIVDGAARDVDEAIDIGYPVFASSATPLTARGRAEEKAWGITIDVGDIAVEHHDYVLADSSGVVFVPAVHAERVIAAAQAIAAKEATMANAIATGLPVSEVMGADYEAMLEQESSP